MTVRSTGQVVRPSLPNARIKWINYANKRTDVWIYATIADWRTMRIELYERRKYGSRARVHICARYDTMHNECARVGKEREGGREDEGRWRDTRGRGICGSVNRGKDASATGLMLLFGFFSSKREPEERTNAARALTVIDNEWNKDRFNEPERILYILTYASRLVNKTINAECRLLFFLLSPRRTIHGEETSERRMISWPDAASCALDSGSEAMARREAPLIDFTADAGVTFRTAAAPCPFVCFFSFFFLQRQSLFTSSDASSIPRSVGRGKSVAVRSRDGWTSSTLVARREDQK